MMLGTTRIVAGALPVDSARRVDTQSLTHMRLKVSGYGTIIGSCDKKARVHSPKPDQSKSPVVTHDDAGELRVGQPGLHTRAASLALIQTSRRTASW